MRPFGLWLRQSPLRQQLSLAMTVGVVFIAVTSSLLSSWQGSRQIRTTLVEQGERITENLAGQSTLALLYGSAENAAEAVDTTLAFPDVTGVEIRLATGQALLTRGSGLAAGNVPVSAELGREAHLEAETGDSWHFIAPVLGKGGDSPFDMVAREEELLGYVRVIQSKATLARMMAEVFLVNLTISFFFALVFMGVIRVLAGRLTRPLTALSEAMARAERGEANVRAEVCGPRDIGEMAKAFNRMIAVLQERETALRESRAHYREVVESVKEVIFQTDGKGRCVLLNPAWREVTGHEVDQALGRPLAEYLHQDDGGRLRWWHDVLEAGDAVHCRYEARVRRSDGSTGWIEITQRARHDSRGRFAGTSGTLDDISERKAAEQALKDLNLALEARVRERTAQLEASNRELEAFSYSVSHDLRAPLRGIEGFAQVLEEELDGKLDESTSGYLARIRAASKRMAQLIDDLLELARITRTTLECTRVDLSAMVRDILDEMAHAEPRRTVSVAVEDGWSARVDPVLFQVVTENLLNNAWKFTRQADDARIEFGTVERDGKPVFFLRDNGAGFDMRFADKLFKPFSRLHSADRFSGTGIGLATVHRIIERHGGCIWAESAPGKGAVFYFSLPEPQRDAAQA